MNNIGVIGGADGTTQIVVSGSIGGPILWIFFGALALMVILYAAFYRRGKGKAVCLALAAVFCVAADQAVKFLVVNTMSPGESEPLLPPRMIASDHWPSGWRTILTSSHAMAHMPAAVSAMSSHRAPEKLDHAAP